MTRTMTGQAALELTQTAELALRYVSVRSHSEALAARLSPEDMQLQSMPDASPAKWHLAHTTWFFETFLLKPYRSGWVSPDEQFNYLYNSYYNSVGEQYSRPDRGKISRPSAAQILAYRQQVDEGMVTLLESSDLPEPVASLVQLGLNHEQQHQELLLTDIKHALSFNPLAPAFAEPVSEPPLSPPPPLQWIDYPEEIVEIGYDGAGFCFDNERPRHRVLLNPFRLSSRLVNCGEFLAFMEDGGYRRPELWLSEGWSLCGEESWKAPLYWMETDRGWDLFTLTGRRELDPDEPVTHVSYFEADAYARWAGSRLATEFEWERAAGGVAVEGHFAESGRFHPTAPKPGVPVPQQLFGDAWEWTMSAYSAYPGYRPPPGAVGEYNGKFMCNQYVLRGGSCATPSGHVRPTYRNFFPTGARWQFSGIRLAQSL